MRPKQVLAAMSVVALLAAGCGSRGGDNGDGAEERPTAPASAVSADFGDLKNVCRPGNPTSSPAQGVTADEINVSTFSDIGFTKKSELVDAAKVFTSWCNENGGINGRKIVSHTRDTQLSQVRARQADACREDFATVGGSAALDGQQVDERLRCLMPDFPAQVVHLENVGSDLQVSVGDENAGYSLFQGYYTWLLEAYPTSKESVALVRGDSPATLVPVERGRQGVTAAGGKITLDLTYPVAGVSDWTPFAQSIKSKGVKGLQFYGQWQQLAKLEQILSTMDYKLDWIDANSNAYGPEFPELLGEAAGVQNNFLDLSGFTSVDDPSVPAVKQLTELFAKYAPGAKLTFQTVRAFSSWLLFAKAAATCGDQLTRKCVFEAAKKETNWTGGGLQAGMDLSTPGAPKCFNVEQLTKEGWKPADFKPDTPGGFRCDAPPVQLTGDAIPKPRTLADVGKSYADFK